MFVGQVEGVGPGLNPGCVGAWDEIPKTRFLTVEELVQRIFLASPPRAQNVATRNNSNLILNLPGNRISINLIDDIILGWFMNIFKEPTVHKLWEIIIRLFLSNFLLLNAKTINIFTASCSTSWFWCKILDLWNFVFSHNIYSASFCNQLWETVGKLSVWCSVCGAKSSGVAKKLA